MSDPITELVRGLNERGKPSLAWTVRWGRNGGCPVAAAWQVSRDGMKMLDLIIRWGGMSKYFSSIKYDNNDHAVYGTYGLVGYTRGDPSATVKLRDGSVIKIKSYDPDGAEDLRRAIPVPPTLQDLIASATRQVPTQ